MLKSTKPTTKGQAAVLARIKHLTEFKWTPVKEIPTYTKKNGAYNFKAGEELTGMPYSSNEPNDKFLFESISLANFLTVIANPDSALYNKEITNGDGKSRAYIGTVCNGLARYAYNIRRRFSTKRWLTVPGMNTVYKAGKYTAEDLKLCDVMYAHFPGQTSHVAMITDLLRDESGKIVKIEVSEMVRPLCKRESYDVDVYFDKYKLYSIMRYDFIEDVKNDIETENLLFGDCDLKKLPNIAVDYGINSNYICPEETVISVFPEGENTIEIYKDDKLFEEIKCDNYGKFIRKFPRGRYTVKHINTGDTVYFSVNQPEISFEKDGDTIKISVDSKDIHSHILYMDFREAITTSLSKVEELTAEEIKTRKITRKIPEDAGFFKIYFENEYGIWTDGKYDFRD